MEQAQGLELLERGGALRRGHFQEANGHADLRLEKYDGLIDPTGAKVLGEALAQRLSHTGANVVVVWHDLEDLVLGFVVAGELGCGLVRAYNADGLVGHSPELRSGARAILVTDQVRDASVVRAIRALLDTRGGALVGVGALVDQGLVEGADITSVIPVAAQVYLPADCPLCRQGVPLESAAWARSAISALR